MPASELELLQRNAKAVFYEPLVGAAAHATAAVLDRVRHGTLPESVARDAVVQGRYSCGQCVRPTGPMGGVPHAASHLWRIRSQNAHPGRARARMARKVAATLIPIPGSPTILALAVIIDTAIGDPSYRAHPVRLIGRTSL